MTEFKASENTFKFVLVIMLLVCGCLAILVLINSYNEINLAFITNNPLLMPALLLQIIASSLFISAWRILLQSQSRIVFTFSECAAQIGITLLGKYLPGKIWGLLGRNYLLTRRQQSSADSMSLLITDQFITFYTGTIIGVLAMLIYYSPGLGILAAVIMAATVPGTSRHYDRIILWMLAHVRFIIRKFSLNFDISVISVHQSQFIGSFLAYTLHWISTAGVLCLLFYPLISNELLLNCTLMIAAIPLAMMSGFVAIWAPGGIGVREAVITGILVLQLPLELAATIAITYRVICIIIDLIIGGFAIYYYSRNTSKLSNNGKTS